MKHPMHIPVRPLLPALRSLALGITSCNDNSCSENGSSLPLATLYVGTSQQNVPGLTIMGIGAPGDNLLADSSTLGEVYLPLRASVGTTAYSIGRWVRLDTVGKWVRDTLTIAYDPVPFFHSTECGSMFNFNLKSVSVTTHGIDSVVTLTTQVTNSLLPSLRIYFTDFAQ